MFKCYCESHAFIIFILMEFVSFFSVAMALLHQLPFGLNSVNKPNKQLGLRGMPLSYDPEQSATWQIIHEEENCQLITETWPN